MISGNLSARFGNGRIDGGAGKDELVISDRKEDWDLYKSGKTHFLIKEVDGLYGTDEVTIQLQNIEKVQFIDGSFNLTNKDKSKGGTTSSKPVSKAQKKLDKEIDLITGWASASGTDQKKGGLGWGKVELSELDPVDDGGRLWLLNDIDSSESMHFTANNKGKIDRFIFNFSFSEGYVSMGSTIKNMKKFIYSWNSEIFELNENLNADGVFGFNAGKGESQMAADWIGGLKGTGGYAFADVNGETFMT